MILLVIVACWSSLLLARFGLRFVPEQHEVGLERCALFWLVCRRRWRRLPFQDVADWIVANAFMAGGALATRIELPTALRAPHHAGRELGFMDGRHYHDVVWSLF
jgi:hypothetical protein